MALEFNSLDDVGNAYVDAAQAESGALFAQGEIVLAAIDKGFKVKQVVNHCASLTRRQARTVFTRYAVARTFPLDKRDSELDWYIHALCAGTDNPYKWLAIAAEGYTDERGNHKGHTSRTLKTAIKAAGGDPDKNTAVILADGIEAEIYGCWIHRLELNVIPMIPQQLMNLPRGSKVIITVVQATAPTESEVAS